MVVNTYQATCLSCNTSFTVNYGKKTDTFIYEIFSCQFCRILFSLDNTTEKKCPQCGNTQLIPYNMHKHENLAYYQKMYEQGILKEEQYRELNTFWKSIRNHTCPVCGKQTLRWSIVQLVTKP
jgi:predicted RNA-binding Zn-ribbon protein involved in translation (DUF1610 family)